MFVAEANQNADAHFVLPSTIKWRTARTTNSVLQWKGMLPQARAIKEPVDYFFQTFTPAIFEQILEQSNLYAVQCNPNKPLDLTVSELYQYFGIVMYMIVFGLPACRMYWSSASRVNVVADTMGRNRWETIKRFLHCADNRQRPENCKDRLYKLRPVIDILTAAYNSVPMDNFLSVDEQVIPFKGKHSLKTYNPKKPKKWGYKAFVLCDAKGITYNFFIYSGATEKVDGFADCGASGNVVLKLIRVVPRDMSYRLFYDNYFSGLLLQVTLEKQGIHSLSTVRSNRLKGAQLQSDKEMKKKRGTFQELCSQVHDVELRVVKWYDNKPVHLLTTYASAQPTSEVERWDRSKKESIKIQCPSTILQYNKSMGGVDLLDCLIALYRTKIRSKKWYHRIMYHFVDMAVVQSWLLYRRDSDAMMIAKNEQ